MDFNRRQPTVNLERYSFCFLRYVHEPLSGEFANVGVLLWAPGSRFLGFRASQKYRRLSHFFHGFQQQDHRQLIARIDTQFQKLAESVGSEQAGLPFPDSPESARDLALKVIPHDDATIYREIYSKAFEVPLVKEHMTEHEIVTPLASHVFPQAWKNGVWNVYQPLSFDLKRSENIKAKAFHWESLTRFLAQSAEKPKIHLLLAAPSGDQRLAYDKARDVLHASGAVELIEEDQVADFARDLEHRVVASA